MTPEELPDAEKGSQPLNAELRKDLLKSLALAFPMLLIGMSVDWLKDRFVTQPGQALWVVIPAIIFLCLIFVRAATRQRLILGWPFLVFLPVYILVFFIAAETNLLDWKRSLVGYENTVPRNFLALNYFGDWHYRFASEKTGEKDLAIVLMKAPETVEAGRLQIADLIGMATVSGAKGVALDFYFENYSEDKGVDDYLCTEIDNAKRTDPAMPVFVAYDFQLKEDRIDRVLIDPDLEKCLPVSQQGHLLAYAEWDGVIRSIPLYFGNNRALESLSLKIAKTFDSQVKVPDNGLLQFVRPVNNFPIVTFDDLETGSDEERSILRDRFILVGEESARDSFHTPYGVRPGIVIHAYAIHSLRQNHFIKRGKWWVSLFMISLLCYLIMVLASRGVGNMRLILINIVFSLFVLTISILTMYFWLTWIDLAYPLLATWLFLFILVGMRKISTRKAKVAFD
jgi:CHASE2 domain-containing sensor protein